MNPIIRIMASPVLFWVQDRKVVRHLEEWKAANQEGNLARAVKLRDTFQPKMDEMQNLGLWGDEGSKRPPIEAGCPPS